MWELGIDIRINVDWTGIRCKYEQEGELVKDIKKSQTAKNEITSLREIKKRAFRRESQRRRCQSRPRIRSKGNGSLIARFTLITQVDPSQGGDKTPEATEPEDLMPEARTQSKDRADWSRSGLKVVERRRSQKAVEGAKREPWE
ncbi:hypothetical protein DFH08DRAFT_813366 [Mycena albidolilacea]|uniref:Uncharacterized protein n=1 Tax=Mycena albidolilacea TaxID=1033008 RepID=A0AAD6ZRB4_9AGAR|nr:hypothetical protein DFH08DRAFT_813366 [Mycena albidolilacea]